VTEASPAEPDAAPHRWVAAAVLGGAGAALVGWILAAGVAVLGWVGGVPGTLGQALGVGTRLWLLGNGAGAQLGDLPITVVPWGATAVYGLVVFRCAAVAGRLARSDPRARPVWVAALVTGGYFVPVVGALLGTGFPAVLGRGAVSVPLAMAAAAAWGAGRGLGRPAPGPTWAHGLARGLLAATLVLLAGGAAALVWSLLAHREQVVALTAGLDPGLSGGLALLLAQLAFAPNAVVWAASYVLGSGFLLGEGTLVAPASTILGLLPGIPLLGGLPGAGPGSTRTLAWLAVGALAGAVTPLGWGRGRGPARVATAALLGGAAGVAAAVLFVGLAWSTGGDLGAGRLQGVGPRMFPLLVLAGSTLGLAGLTAGLLRAALRRRPGSTR